MIMVLANFLRKNNVLIQFLQKVAVV
jgi:hypothetical protein